VPQHTQVAIDARVLDGLALVPQIAKFVGQGLVIRSTGKSAKYGSRTLR